MCVSVAGTSLHQSQIELYKVKHTTVYQKVQRQCSTVVYYVQSQIILPSTFQNNYNKLPNTKDIATSDEGSKKNRDSTGVLLGSRGKEAALDLKF